jgi:hypothetical protein
MNLSESGGNPIKKGKLFVQRGIDYFPRGIDDPYIEKFTVLNRNCVEKNSEKEKAKGNLKKMTADLMEMVKELGKEMQFCKRVVMTEIPKPLWKEFGIQERQARAKPKEGEKSPEEKKDNPS